MLIIKPTKNDPSIETIKLLPIDNLKIEPKKQAKRIQIQLFIFTLKKLNKTVS